MKIFKFAGHEYKTEQSVRLMLFRKENLVLPSKMLDENWAKVGVQVEYIDPVYTEEQLARQARTKRDRLLAACDYYVMPDYPSTEEGLAEVKAYRQALRDISKQEGFPSDVAWPEVPEVLQ